MGIPSDELRHAGELNNDDRRRIRDALRYLARDLHYRSFAVTAERRQLLWEEMDRCLALADRLADPAEAGLSARHGQSQPQDDASR